MNYLEALAHEEVFAPFFAGPSWSAWRTVEKAIFGLPLDPGELPLFRELTGREEAPTEPATEAWIIAGRRSAKSRKAATIGTYLATIGAELAGYRERLAPGERGVVMILAVDKVQAKVTLSYAQALFSEVPLLRQLVERDSGDGLELTNRMSLVVAANDYRSVRGRTIVAAVFDEVSYWRNDFSSRPDSEVFRAVKPALASMPGSLLIGISSPYRRVGLLWQKFKRHWGKAGSVLVVKAPTTTLNPGIDRQVIAEALEDDPAAARAEWLAEFRDDLSDFVSREVVEALVDVGVFERPPVGGRTYGAFTDPSGGSSDSFTLAIVHQEGEAGVLDVLRERTPPFSPEAVVEEFSGVLRSYGISTVTGDRYAGQWPGEAFKKRGIRYETSARTKSEIYLEALPLLNGSKLDLLDNVRLVTQICGLERRTARGGRECIDHGPHGHDDLANAALGALLLCRRPALGPVFGFARIVIGSPARTPRDRFPWTVERRNCLH
jgi:hypothetical protein